MQHLIEQTIARTRFDLVIASQLSTAAYYRSFRGIPAIFEEAELGIYWPYGENSGSLGTRVRKRLTWAKHSRFMSQLLENFSLCTVVSEEEQRCLAAAAPGYKRVHVIPNSVDADEEDTVRDRIPGSMIFTGSLRYAPNRAAMTWFMNEVFPAVRSQVPNARLTITGHVGEQPPTPVSNVVLTGRVPDVRPLVRASEVSLAPIHDGGGTRLKILEAMALRTPVVATAKAAEGLGARDGEHLLIADTPGAFANAVVRLLQDPAEARSIADGGWRLFRARYDTKAVVPRFLELVESLNTAPEPAQTAELQAVKGLARF
jgi:glycosyltransferase involved in cell wall biosynthesis